MITIYAMFADPTEIQRQLSGWLGNLPEEAQALMTDQLSRLARQTTGALTWSTVVAVALALWTASSGMANLIKAINMAYDEEDDRNFLVRRGLALLLSLGAIVLLIGIAFAVTAVFPWLSELTGSAVAAGLGQVLAWILAGAAFAFALAVLYRVGAHRDNAEWKWVTVGAIVALILWLGATVLFRIYVANFGTYNETYGSLAAVVILFFWLYITSFVVLLGAQINAESEHETRANTTVGRDNRWVSAMPRWPTPLAGRALWIRTVSDRRTPESVSCSASTKMHSISAYSSSNITAPPVQEGTQGKICIRFGAAPNTRSIFPNEYIMGSRTRSSRDRRLG